ncbi:hypothetical protein GR925_33845 [Streptomyces sp. HUCO-GS316]|uniref:hypothetical protein n=1 Tax=Streptomyces sp. HUCO-GS316 TaxID=2692198 RepID=UPI00136E3CF1|nr:hypothetical protein [Streptomyces sp. HUCO-GS316]MXM68279.1 hypothetical protein [Streptomyces sp. HUCO-GS316]
MASEFHDGRHLSQIVSHEGDVRGFQGHMRGALTHGDVGRRERGSVVGSVADHGDDAPLGLEVANELPTGQGRGGLADSGRNNTVLDGSW